MPIQLESRTQASSKRMLVRAKIKALTLRPESFKFRLNAITITDKGLESFPYGKYTMMKELYK